MPSTLHRLAAGVIVPLVLAGCASGSSSSSSSSGREASSVKSPAASAEQAAAPSAVKSPGEVRVNGLVYVPSGGYIPRASRLTVELVDATTSGQERTIVDTVRRVDTVPPYSFTLIPKRGAIQPGRLYQVRAKLKVKDATWTSTQALPVLTGGAPAYVEIPLGPAR